MRILFLSRWFPYPPDNGSKIRVFNLIKSLSRDHSIDLIAFTKGHISEAQVIDAKKFCRSVSTTPYWEFNPVRIKAILGYFSRLPRSIVDTHNKAFEKLVVDAGKKSDYDLVIASQIDTACYADTLHGPLRILEELELTTRVDQIKSEDSGLTLFRKKLGWWKFSQYVKSLLRSLDGCTVVSEKEKDYLLKIYPGYKNVSIVPNGVDVDSYNIDHDFPSQDTMIYSGALNYYANFDAMDYFLREIFPIIVSKQPTIKLFITGKKYHKLIKKLPSSPNVIFTGYLENIQSMIASSWCSLVPLRYGGGTRIKILEAMALGTPVVSTSKGAEGLRVEHNHDILIADKPQAFAHEVLRLMNSVSLREKLSNNGYQTVSQYYDWKLIGQDFLDFIDQLKMN